MGSKGKGLGRIGQRIGRRWIAKSGDCAKMQASNPTTCGGNNQSMAFPEMRAAFDYVCSEWLGSSLIP
jgi:hypothetical protein